MTARDVIARASFTDYLFKPGCAPDGAWEVDQERERDGFLSAADAALSALRHAAGATEHDIITIGPDGTVGRLVWPKTEDGYDAAAITPAVHNRKASQWKSTELKKLDVDPRPLSHDTASVTGFAVIIEPAVTAS